MATRIDRGCTKKLPYPSDEYDPTTQLRTRGDDVVKIETTCPVLTYKDSEWINLYWTGMSQYILINNQHLTLDDVPIDMYHWANLVGYISEKQNRKVQEAKAKREEQRNKSRRRR